jgi:hypothetical protein
VGFHVCSGQRGSSAGDSGSGRGRKTGVFAERVQAVARRMMAEVRRGPVTTNEEVALVVTQEQGERNARPEPVEEGDEGGHVLQERGCATVWADYGRCDAVLRTAE